MSDQTDVQATETDEMPEASTEMSPEEMKREIEKLRKENAAKRVKNREAEAKMQEAAKKWEDHELSQLTEMERLTKEKADLEVELQKTRIEKMRSDMIAKYKLDEDLHDFITGTDEGTMRKQAEKLAAKFSEREQEEQAPSNNPLDLYAGDRGRPVRKSQGLGGEFLLGLSDSRIQ